MTNNFAGTESKVQLLVALAQDPEKWAKQYGKKSLSEVLSTFMDVEGLIRSGLSVDTAVQIKAENNGHTILGNKTVYIAKCHKPKKQVQKKERKECILVKKDGTKVHMIQRGDKMVVVGGKKKSGTKTAAPTIVKDKKTGTLKSKRRTVKIPCINGFTLVKVFEGDALVEQYYKVN